MEAQLIEKTETTLALKRVFQAPKAMVFRAWVDPAMMNKWLFPAAGMHAICSVDLRIGGRYEVQMHPPEGSPDGAEDVPDGAPYIVAGEYREIVPEEKLVFTWQWQGNDDSEVTLVTISFRAISESETELSLLHERFASEESRDNHAEGWEGTFVQLAIALN